MNYDTVRRGGKTVTQPAPMSTVLRRITATGWPRRVDKALFVHDGDNVIWLDSAAALFAWLGLRDGTVRWRRGTGYVTKEEAFEAVRLTAEQYAAVETYPHYPPLRDHYYACAIPEPGDGARLKELIDFFAMETPLDRQLLQAALATPLWGGPPGRRPAFLFTCLAGRGKGKTTLAEMLGRVFGGVVAIDPRAEIGKVKERLLSPNAATTRVALLDNVKTPRFSWGELESLITADTISGKQLYVGEGTRANYLTWTVTLNGASLSTDMAQRVVEIRIREPEYRGQWFDEVAGFVDEHRMAILDDLAAFLRRPKTTLARHTRWATWEGEVLARVDSPQECLDLILHRRQSVDVEEEEGQLIQAHFEATLRRLGYDTDRDDVFVPSDIVARWINAATGEKLRTTTAGRKLRQFVDEGRIDRLVHYRVPGDGRRGFRWVGQHCDAAAPTLFDLPDRVKSRHPQEDVKDVTDVTDDF